jgi:hypothetical protein
MNWQSSPSAVSLARSPLEQAVSSFRDRVVALLARVREVAARDVPGYDEIANMDSRMLRDIGVESAFVPHISERRDVQFPRL